MYVYGFCCPEAGGSFFLLLPRVKVAAMNLALKAFAEHLAETPRRVLLVVDRAGWHTSPSVAWPAGIEAVYLPPKSPELQPPERLWKLLDEVLANQPLAALELVEALLAGRCCWLMAHPEVVRLHTLFSWWPLLRAA